MKIPAVGQRFNLSEKTALVTGGAGLLGVEHARALAQCGARVVLADIKQERLKEVEELLTQEFSSDQIFSMQMDVTRRESIEKVCRDLVSRTHGVEILINNAAIDPKVSPKDSLGEESRLENFSLERWSLELSVGLTGAFLCSQVFGSAMARGGTGGVILNISSDLSVIAPDQRLYHKPGIESDHQPVKPVTYSVIKTALIGLTRYLAGYWAGAGIRVNALSPGGVYNYQPEEFVTRISQLIPLGRMAHIHEYHGAIQFLCSDASSYMTGQNLVIDGGRSIL